MTYAIDRIEALLDEGVRNKVYPGTVWAVGDSAAVAPRAPPESSIPTSQA